MGGGRMSHSHGNQGGGNYFMDPQTNFLRGGPGSGHQGPSGSGKHGGHMGGEGPMNNMGMMNNNNNNNNGGFYNQN